MTPEALEALRAAIRDEGPNPLVHRKIMERHRREWPTLWRAIDWEEYRCGCVSATVRTKRELPGYCPTHGEDSRGAQREIPRRVAEAFRRERNPRGSRDTVDRD